MVSGFFFAPLCAEELEKINIYPGIVSYFQGILPELFPHRIRPDKFSSASPRSYGRAQPIGISNSIRSLISVFARIRGQGSGKAARTGMVPGPARAASTQWEWGEYGEQPPEQCRAPLQGSKHVLYSHDVSFVSEILFVSLFPSPRCITLPFTPLSLPQPTVCRFSTAPCGRGARASIDSHDKAILY